MQEIDSIQVETGTLGLAVWKGILLHKPELKLNSFFKFPQKYTNQMALFVSSSPIPTKIAKMKKTGESYVTTVFFLVIC